MPIDAEKMMLRRTHRNYSNRLPGERFERQMIEQVFQRTGERSAIDRARDDHAVGATHTRDDPRSVVIMLFGWPAVRECDFLFGEIDQFDLEIISRRASVIEKRALSRSHRVAVSSRPGGVTLPTIAITLVAINFLIRRRDRRHSRVFPDPRSRGALLGSVRGHNRSRLRVDRNRESEKS